MNTDAVTEHHLVIVGGGPMCTYAMAQLAAVLPEREPGIPVRITVFERGGRHGAGQVHSDTQARTSYLNRVAGQIAFAADESQEPAVPLLPRTLRPTFLEWCRERHARTQDPHARLGPADVPRRYLHGLALRDMFQQYTARLAAVPGVSVELRTAEVTDVSRAPEGTGRFAVRTRPGPAAGIPADQVLFVTGHAWNRPAPGSAEDTLAGHARRHPGTRHVGRPYPLHEQLDETAVPPGERVIVRGLGLTALDVFLHLTEGRGGRFVPVPEAGPHGLRYLPGGREPSLIVGVSPSGVPVHGRARNDKALRPGLEHRGVFFTRQAVRRLRRSVGVPRERHLPGETGETPPPCLDFDRHLFPLVVLEMAWVHHLTALGGGAAAALRARVTPHYECFLDGHGPWGEEGADRLTEAMCARAGRTLPRPFDWRAILEPLPARSARPGERWHGRVVAHLRQDLADCLEGNVSNPVKAACDGVWRDLRAVFSEAVDHGGLSADSHRRFAGHHLRLYNRLSNGAGVEPMRKLLALADAGLLDLSTGPEPEVTPEEGRAGFRVTGRRTGVTHRAPAVVEARVHPFDPWLDVSPLYRNMLRNGLVRQWRNPGAAGGSDYVPGALDLTPDLHPVLPGGGTEPRLTFMGGPAEGLRVFQLSAARPHADSYLLNIAARWAEQAVRATAPPARLPEGEAARR